MVAMIRRFVLIAAAIVILFLVISYLREDTTPSAKPGIVMHKRLRPLMASIRIITPPDKMQAFQQVSDDLAITSQIVPAIDRDEIACVKASSRDSGTGASNALLVLPESGDQGGDVLVSQNNETLYKMENPLLGIAKRKEKRVNKSLNDILLQLDQTGDKFRTRFENKMSEIRNEFATIKSEIIRACHEQKSRLKVTHPHLARYDFINESVHGSTGSTEPLPRYVFGDNQQTPLNLVIPPKDTQSSMGLIHEHRPALSD